VVSALVADFAVAVLTAYLIVHFSLKHAFLSTDTPESGPQKFHNTPTPRLGGVAILFGLTVGALAARTYSPLFEITVVLVICALFAFAGGLVEDFTKRVRVRLRLLLTFVSATLGYFLLDARITQLALPGLDWALGFTAVSLAFTLFAVGGFAQAMNIVDGFNGLAGVVALILLAAIAYVCRVVGDEAVMWSALLLGGAIAGFLVLNYPKGRLFLGDGGAYLIGFLIAELAVLLVHRNTEVSPWFALGLFSYPVVEVMFSIYRKRVLRGQSPGDPDGLHLHMLVHKRLIRNYRRNGIIGPDTLANSLTSPFLWILAALPAFPTALFWHDTAVLQAIVIAFTGLYLTLYWRIVRFRTPRLLCLRRSRSAPFEEVTSSTRT
jgi:UDP-N-acetylmuramyl pentapeptide phosphotransferase/UDP-N-acetylglucosamine-1-phosphate transferase